VVDRAVDRTVDRAVDRVVDGAGNLRRQIAALEARLVEEIRVNAELDEALSQMELRALQSQVNPHFLFNTLGAISGQAMLENASRTSHLVLALSRLLRYSLRRIAQVVTMEEEFRNISDYLLIQLARFGDRVTVGITLDPAARLAEIPLLTVQPLVENAFIHGIEGRERGAIEISAHRRDDLVVVEVEDDGVGIPPERLACLLAERTAAGAGGGGGGETHGPPAAAWAGGSSHSTGLGLANVNRRVQYHFGDGYGLTIESDGRRGAVARVTIPYREARRGGG
jgi:two-component system LytT family sensor kinase